MSEQEEPAAIDPQQHIEPQSPQEEFLKQLLGRLWSDYRERVSYVRDYEKIVLAHNATFVNDHVAFRSISKQRPAIGMGNIARIFQAAGYFRESMYEFPDKHLSAFHMRHSNPALPKIFISEFKAWEAGHDAREAIHRVVAEHRPHFSDAQLAGISNLAEGEDDLLKALVESAAAVFLSMPWDPPQRSDVAAIDKESQYAAWVAVHGYRVNHFTSSVNSHGVESLNDIEKTMAALRAAGVPVKSEIEGAVGSKLRQSATEAVEVDVALRDGSEEITTAWNYAYFEIAERGEVVDPETGRKIPFEGFLGPQASQLFEMTGRKS